MYKGKPVLIVGADGIIGSALAESLKNSSFDMYSTTRRMVLADSERSFFLNLLNPDANGLTKQFLDNCSGGTAFILAAETSVAECARNPNQTHAINVIGTKAIAQFLIESGMRVVFLSTNLVFDGSIPHRNADDSPCPQTEYGKQKAEAEQKLLAMSSDSVIVRLTKVFNTDHSLIKSWCESLRANQIIQPFSDMVVAPVSLNHAVNVLCRLVDAQAKGIFHVSGPEDVTYADIAKQLAKQLGCSRDLVQPVKSDVQEGDRFPAHTTLDTGRLEQVLGVAEHDVWSFLALARDNQASPRSS